jgi:hypothetical protein
MAVKPRLVTSVAETARAASRDRPERMGSGNSALLGFIWFLLLVVLLARAGIVGR